MTDQITTPAQMREAVEQAVLAEKMRMMSWCAKRQAVSRKAWERAARKALTGDISDLRNRIAMIDAEPLDIVLSGADGDALPVAEPEPQALRVKPLSDEDRDWIDARADELFRANERARGGVRIQTITPQDFRDYFVVTATRERILSQIVAERTVDASETPVCDHQRGLMSESERQAIRDRALDDAAQAASNRAAYFRDAAETASEAGFHASRAFHAMRELCLVEIAAAIRLMKGNPE